MFNGIVKARQARLLASRLYRYYARREGEAARVLLAVTVVAGMSVSGAVAQQQQPCPTDNISGSISARMNPAIAAQREFERAVCEYRNCLGANQNDANACEGLRHIMDATAQAAGQANGPR